MSLAISSSSERALLNGDVTTNPAQVTEPDWVFAFDMDAAVARKSKIDMIDRAEAEDAVLIAWHFHGYGKVVRTEGRRYWQVV